MLLLLNSFALLQEKFDEKKVKYDYENNFFVHVEDTSSNFSIENFFITLKDSSKKLNENQFKDVLSIIKKYDLKMKNYNILLEKYNKGIESIDGLGRRGSESNYLINNGELWYMWALIIGILPAVPWLKEQQKQQEIDRQMRSKSYYSGEGANPEYYKPMATLGIKPGIIISIIGFFGSKIKLGEKEYLIKHESVQEPRLSDILMIEEISLILKIYNNMKIN